MVKKIPMRQCVGCGEMKEKKQMIRVLRSVEGEQASYCLDATGRKNGRGAYICKSVQCLQLAFKKKGLDRSFKASVPEDVYNQLKEELSNLDAE